MSDWLEIARIRPDPGVEVLVGNKGGVAIRSLSTHDNGVELIWRNPDNFNWERFKKWTHWQDKPELPGATV